MNDENVTKSHILESAKIQGFNLEFKVFNLLKELESSDDALFSFDKIVHSRLYETDSGPCEIDIFARFKIKDDKTKGAFYFECKGGSKDSKLILADSSRDVYQREGRNRYMLLANNNKKGSTPNLQVVHDKFSNHYEYENPNLFLTINGDFFIRNRNNNATPKYTATKKEPNAFYKAIVQLENILCHQEGKGITEEITGEKTCDINLVAFPVIVIRPEIFVVRYGDTEDQHRVWQKVPWVLHRSTMSKEMVSIENDGSKPPSGKVPVYFAVVNIDHLEEFINQIPHGCIYKSDMPEEL